LAYEAIFFFPSFFLPSNINNFFQVARHPDAATVVTGIVGCAGLKVIQIMSLSLSLSYLTNVVFIHIYKRSYFHTAKFRQNLRGSCCLNTWLMDIPSVNTHVHICG
jgi:hypothetical protein